MMTELTADVFHIGNTEQVSDTFKKRVLVVRVNRVYQNDVYEQFYKLELKQDKTTLADGLEIGQKVNVKFYADCRQYTRKDTGEVDYFTTLVCTSVEHVAGVKPVQAQPQTLAKPQAEQTAMGIESGVKFQNANDDVPF